jgi:hypothetical protein
MSKLDGPWGPGCYCRVAEANVVVNCMVLHSQQDESLQHRIGKTSGEHIRT